MQSAASSSGALGVQSLRPDRIVRPATSLAEQMMIEAEFHLYQNWTDVAIHDRRKISSALLGQTFLWIIRTEEQGTSLLPLFNNLSERKLFTEKRYKDVCPLYAFLLRCHGMHRKFKQKYNAQSNKCYLVTKGARSSGALQPLTFQEAVHLISAGQLCWTVDGLKPVCQDQ